MAATATSTTTQTHPPNPLLKAPPPVLPRSNLVCFSVAAYSKTLIHHLRSLDIPILSGLTNQEFSSIESTSRFTFPPDLRSILQEGLPVDPSFPNWRSSSPQQLNILLNLPILSLLKNIRLHNFWSQSWGAKPSNSNEALSLVKRLLKTAPLLVPIYRNCYIPSTPNMAGNPVFYVDGDEVRILSFDVTRFFQEVEFLRKGGVIKPFMRKKSNGINNNKVVPAWAATVARKIDFWTDVAERGRRVVARGVSMGWWRNSDDPVEEEDFGLDDCLEEVFWRLRDGGWKEEEVREMMMMDGCDHTKTKMENGTQLLIHQEDIAWQVRFMSVVLLRAGWTNEDVVYSLDLEDMSDEDNDDENDNEKSFLEIQYPNSYYIVEHDDHPKS